MPAADPYQAKLREALVNAVPTHFARERRRAVRRRVVLALVASLALVATVVTVALPDDRADARIDIETRDGRVYMRLLDFESRPEEIVGALRIVGVAAVVDSVPVGPSNIGRFVGVTTEGGSVEITEGSENSFRAFSINQDYKGVLRLALGRAAEPGEQWRAPSNATAPGEALACRDFYGMTAAEAARSLEGLPVSVRWFAVPKGILDPGAELTEPYASWRVIDALATSTDAVLVRLTVDGAWPFLIDRPPRIDPSCKGR